MKTIAFIVALAVGSNVQRHDWTAGFIAGCAAIMVAHELIRRWMG